RLLAQVAQVRVGEGILFPAEGPNLFPQLGILRSQAKRRGKSLARRLGIAPGDLQAAELFPRSRLVRRHRQDLPKDGTRLVEAAVRGQEFRAPGGERKVHGEEASERNEDLVRLLDAPGFDQ